MRGLRHGGGARGGGCAYAEVLLVGGVAEVFVHLEADDAAFVPLGPDGRLRAQRVAHHEVLVKTKLLRDRFLPHRAAVLK